MPKLTVVDPLSGTSLRIEPLFQGVALATATGFTVIAGGKPYLVTNWHVVTGRNPDTGQCLDSRAAVPDRLRVHFHRKGRLGEWYPIEVALQAEDAKPIWIEHPLGRAVDVVALPVPDSADIEIYPLDLALGAADIVVTPAMPASIIGYPLGLKAGENWPIWKTGHIASDVDIDFEPGRPGFLIDATGRSGMSGSPVVLRLNGGYSRRDGSFIMSGGVATKFLGVYAGRLDDRSEIGRVWRPFVIKEIIDDKLHFDDETARQVPSRNDSCPCNRGKRFKACCGQFG